MDECEHGFEGGFDCPECSTTKHVVLDWSTFSKED